MSELTGHSPERSDAGQAARLLLARLGSVPGLFSPAEEALLRQWLHTLARGHESKDREIDQFRR